MLTATCVPYRDRTVLVSLHVYDYTGNDLVTGTNDILNAFGLAAYHVGIEVHCQEWTFSQSSGVSCRSPTKCADHAYRKAEVMGRTELSQREVEQLLAQLSREWPASDYDLLRKNSGHFAVEFCDRLGVDEPPEWVLKLARKGAMIGDGIQMSTDGAKAVADAVGGVAMAISNHLGAVTDGSRDAVGKILDQGKGARGASVSDSYQFGDLTRGLLRGAGAGLALADAGAINTKVDMSAPAAGIMEMSELASAVGAGETQLDEQLGISDEAQQAVVSTCDMAKDLAARATQLNEQLSISDRAQQAMVNAQCMAEEALRKGKEARGATDADGYKFGDLTRGLLQHKSVAVT